MRLVTLIDKGLVQALLLREIVYEQYSGSENQGISFREEFADAHEEFERVLLYEMCAD